MWIVGGDHHGWIPPRDAPGDVSASPARLAACSCGPTTTAGRPRDTGGRHARPAHEDRHCSGRPAHHQVQDRPGHQPDHRLHLPRTRRWGGIPGDGSILLLVCMLPTSAYHAGTSPFVTVFDAMGPHWIGSLIQGVLIVAAMSSLNSGLYTTGRVPSRPSHRSTAASWARPSGRSPWHSAGWRMWPPIPRPTTGCPEDVDAPRGDR
ncbi:MAG: hypothetical protein WAV52_00415 [Luteococcus japonicus]